MSALKEVRANEHQYVDTSYYFSKEGERSLTAKVSVMAILTWLHLSDWHQRGTVFDIDRKLVRDKLLEDLRGRAGIDAALAEIDFIVFSGDLAFSGAAGEYAVAKSELLEPVLDAVSLKDPARIFFVPGNHDFSREHVREMLPAALQKPLENRDQLQAWLGDDKKRARVLEPFEEYANFINAFNGQSSPCYASRGVFDLPGIRVALLGVNSSWMCGRNTDAKGEVNDYGYALIGEAQIHDALQQMATAHLRIAVIHHPFDWVREFDRQDVEARLMRECHVVLRGHQHFPQAQVVRGTGGDCLIIPAGACYDRRRPTDARYACSYNLVKIDSDSGEGVVYFRRWSEGRKKWIKDEDAHDEGIFPFTLPSYQAAYPPSPASHGGKGGVATLSDPVVSCKRYLMNFYNRYCCLPLPAMGGEVTDAPEITLDQLYVELDTTTPVAEKRVKGKREVEAIEREEISYVSALEAAAKAPRLVLLGDPGSGKSTFANRLAIWLAKCRLEANETPPPGFSAALLPVAIILRDFYPALQTLSLPEDGLPAQAQKDELLAAIHRHFASMLQSLGADDYYSHLLQELSSGQCLLVFDGLDEVPERLRLHVRLALAELLARYRPARVIVTCRKRSYTEATALPGFTGYQLAPFDPERVSRFAHTWYAIQVRLGRVEAAKAARQADDLASGGAGGGLARTIFQPHVADDDGHHPSERGRAPTRTRATVRSGRQRAGASLAKGSFDA